jgi:hypothetical protein
VDVVVSQLRFLCKQHHAFLAADHPSTQLEYPASQSKGSDVASTVVVSSIPASAQNVPECSQHQSALASVMSALSLQLNSDVVVVGASVASSGASVVVPGPAVLVLAEAETEVQEQLPSAAPEKRKSRPALLFGPVTSSRRGKVDTSLKWKLAERRICTDERLSGDSGSSSLVPVALDEICMMLLMLFLCRWSTSFEMQKASKPPMMALSFCSSEDNWSKS